MGRRVIVDNAWLIHPLLHLSFLAAGLAASMVIITAICSVRFRRRSKPSPPQPPPQSNPLEIAKESNNSTPQPQTKEQETEHHEKTEHHTTENTEDTEVKIKELPLPPAMLQPKEGLPSVNLIKMTSERKASFRILSLKMPRSLSVAINGVGEHIHQKEDKFKGMLKTEESVWMKTIILGEKCVPDEEDPVIYDGKGKKISAYHPKSYSSVSRQCSFLDPDALLSLPQNQEERIVNNTLN